MDATGTSVRESYVYGDQIIAQSTQSATSYFHADHLGSTRLLTNSTGTSVDDSVYNYEPYGLPTAGDGSLTSYAFTGQFREADLGLQYHRARWLNCATAGWLSSDPVFDWPGNFGNGYGYVGANPIVRKDSNGLFTFSEIGAVNFIMNTLAIGAAAGTVTGLAFGGMTYAAGQGFWQGFKNGFVLGFLLAVIVRLDPKAASLGTKFASLAKLGMTAARYGVLLGGIALLLLREGFDLRALSLSSSIPSSDKGRLSAAILYLRTHLNDSEDIADDLESMLEQGYIRFIQPGDTRGLSEGSTADGMTFRFSRYLLVGKEQTQDWDIPSVASLLVHEYIHCSGAGEYGAYRKQYETIQNLRLNSNSRIWFQMLDGVISYVPEYSDAANRLYSNSD